MSRAENDTAEVLVLSELRVDTPSGDPIIEDITLQLRQGEILGLVGESGSGKTTLALALFDYGRAGATIRGGQLALEGKPLESWSSMRSARGKIISYVPQDSGSALNPSLRVAGAIDDMLVAHRGKTDANARGRVLEMVGLPAAQEFERRFPHQLSGGQQQRVSTAIALVADPRIVVLDEPTTGLDVVTQARLLEELLRLRDEESVAMLYVSHDLAVVGQIADRIAVMYGGRIVEEGPTEAILRQPRHPYTRGLLSSIPDHRQPRRLEPMEGVAVGVGDRPDGCPFAPRCPLRQEHCTVSMPSLEDVEPNHQVRCFEWRSVTDFRVRFVDLEARSTQGETAPVLEARGLCAEHRSRGGVVIAAEDVSFALQGGECVALVGESGSGKTTIARTIVGLHPPTAGSISLGGVELAPDARRRSLDQRRRIQIVFQNPSQTLNPRHTVADAIVRPLRFLARLSRADAEKEVQRLLELVRLPSRLAKSYPAELSGGERQRVAIARALAPGPELIICDEITSALDVSVQAAVLKLLDDLRDQLKLSMLFISHDLGVVATIADRVLVLENGRICEAGSVGTVLREPVHPYTQRLLAAAPSLTAAQSAEDSPPSTIHSESRHKVLGVVSATNKDVYVAGVAETPLGKVPDQTELSMVSAAAREALAEAGLTLQDVDAIFVNYMGEEGSVRVGEYLGIQPRYADSSDLGGGSFEAFVHHAMLALTAGHCDVALVAYASRQRSRRSRALAVAVDDSLSGQFEAPYGLPLAIGQYALIASRHMYEYGTTPEQLAHVAVSAREWAKLNPKAWARDDLTVDDVLASPMITEPFHKLDCCLRTDGGGAFVLTRADRAKDAAKRAIRVLGAAESHTHWHISEMPDLTVTCARESGRLAFERAGITAGDVDVLEPYDNFTSSVILQLEDLGFCEKGEGGAFVEEGHLRPGGRLPAMTMGGGLSYCHPGALGVLLIVEAVRQLRGEAGDRQVPDPEIAVVHGIGGISNSAAATVVLGRD